MLVHLFDRQMALSWHSRYCQIEITTTLLIIVVSVSVNQNKVWGAIFSKKGPRRVTLISIECTSDLNTDQVPIVVNSKKVQTRLHIQ